MKLEVGTIQGLLLSEDRNKGHKAIHHSHSSVMKNKH